MLFNVVLERMDVASESPLTWLVWGLRSLIGPIANIVRVAIMFLALMAVWLLIRRLVPAADRWSRRVAESISRAGRRVGWDDPDGFGQIVFVIALVYLAIVWVNHWTLIAAAMTRLVSDLTADQLAVLSPANADEHYSYRSALDFLALGTGLALYRLIRLRQGRTNRGSVIVVFAIAAMFVLATFLWDGPYRLLFQAERPRIEVDGQRCYNLGERQFEILMYCPDGPQPKVRRVRSDDPGLHDTGITESVFTSR
jgi:hypothetical protein